MSDNINPPALQFLRGTKSQNDRYTGPEGSLTYDRTQKKLRLHDGTAEGGHELTSFPEAPVDGHQYVRQDGEWIQVEVPEGDTGGVESLDAGPLPPIPEGVSTQYPGRAFFGPDVGAYIDNEGRLFVSGILGQWNDPSFLSNEWVEIMPERRFRMVHGCRWDNGIIAIATDQTMWVAGKSNRDGSLGRDDVTIWPPEQFDDANDWWFVHLSEYDGFYAIKTDGTLWAWGDNGFGQLGIEGLGTSFTKVFTPMQVGTDTDWRYVETVYWQTAGYKENGDLYLWGRGLGFDPDIVTPQYLDTYPQDSVGSKLVWGHSIKWWIKSDGTLWWKGTGADTEPGENDRDYFVWTQYGTDTDWDFGSRPGSWSIMMLFKTDGTMYVYGELWDDAGTNLEVPTEFLPGVKFTYAIGLFEDSLIALTEDGDLYGLNENWGGTLGLGHTDAAGSPELIGSDFAWIDGDYWRMIAGKKDGSIWKWGTNYRGELGCDDTEVFEITVPTPINSCPIT